MDNLENILEDILCSAYKNLIYNEEYILKQLSGLTLKEFHTIDIISECMKKNTNKATNIAKILGITMGTLTTNIDRLCDKGYVIREKQDNDKRITIINLTNEGMDLKKRHDKYHKKLVKDAINKLSDSEKVSLINAINKIEI